MAPEPKHLSFPVTYMLKWFGVFPTRVNLQVIVTDVSGQRSVGVIVRYKRLDIESSQNVYNTVCVCMYV